MSNGQNKMAEYNLRVKKILPGGVHYNFNMPWEETPIHFINTKNSRVWDMNNKEYLDLYARFGAMIVGHNNHEYNETLKECIDRVLSVSHCDLDAEVLELITKFVPSAEMIRFGLSGTEMVQNALRLARAYTHKNKFIRFENHYHGNADNIMGGKQHSVETPIPEDFLGDLKGTLGRADDIMAQQSYLIPWNDEECLEKLLKEKSSEIAAIITEPVCVNGGSVMPKEGYLSKMRQLCDQYGVLLIFDEIITGFRMGLGGAQSYFNVIPDLTILGKALGGGGVPVSALAGKKEIMELLIEKKVIHAGTFNGYTLGTFAIKATLECLSRNDGEALKTMNTYTAQLHQILRDKAKKVGMPLVVQGPLGCGAYHCCEKELTSPSDYTFDITSLDIILNAELAKQGVLMSSLSRIYPNILLNKEDVEWFDYRVEKALLETKKVYDEINN
ncbi:aspartate aminotransferase family protein [Enterococcus silesiacus]|nr:aminotransferase class III-fold pyridoxal phosphate-dependent enzyme [Enterococcus silesiacus]